MKHTLSAALPIFAFCLTVAAASAAVTPLQAYENEVTSRMRVVWLRLATQRADYLSVGTVKVRFEITSAGGIKNLKVVSNTANEALENVALQTIRATHIPPIPKRLMSTLVGGGLPVDYDFTVYPTK